MGRSWSTTKKVAVAGVLTSGVLAGGVGLVAFARKRAPVRPRPYAPPARPESPVPPALPRRPAPPAVDWSRAFRRGGLESRECDYAAGEHPGVLSGNPVRVLPDKVIKYVGADARGLQELTVTQEYERYGLGPKVLNAYLCSNENFPGASPTLAIEYERLDGSLAGLYRRYLHVDPKRLVRPVEGVLNLLRQCRAVGLLHGDAHGNNIMYKQQPDGSLRWYAIDHGRIGVQGAASQAFPYDMEVDLRMELWYFKQGINPGQIMDDEHIGRRQLFERLPADAQREIQGHVTMDNARGAGAPSTVRIARSDSAGPAVLFNTYHPGYARQSVRERRRGVGPPIY